MGIGLVARAFTNRVERLVLLGDNPFQGPIERTPDANSVETLKCAESSALRGLWLFATMASSERLMGP